MALDDKKIEEIRKQAKEILDKFSKELGKVSVDEKDEWNVVRDEDRRAESEGKDCDKDFRKIMLENSPQHDDDFIIAERKTW